MGQEEGRRPIYTEKLCNARRDRKLRVPRVREGAAKFGAGEPDDELDRALRHRQAHLKGGAFSFGRIEGHRPSRKIEERLNDIEAKAGAFFVALYGARSALEFGEYIASRCLWYADAGVGHVELEHASFRALPRIHADATGSRRVVERIFHQITDDHIERLRVDGINRAAKAQFAFKNDAGIFEICQEALTGRKDELIRLVCGNGTSHVTLIDLHEAEQVLNDLVHAL